MTTTFRPMALAGFLVLAAALPQAQSPASILESYTRARTLLDAAVAAHGGPDALAAARHVRVQFDGHDVWRNQSRAVEPPYDRERLAIDLMIDLDRQRLLVERASSFTGGLHNHALSITDGTKGFNVNKRRQTHVVQQPPAADTQVGSLYLIPQFLLIKARENTPGLRWVGRAKSASGADVDVITTSTPQGQMTMSIDPKSSQLRGYTTVVGDALAGDAVAEVEFLDYKPLNGVPMPSRRRAYRAGELTQELAITSVTPKFDVPAALLTPPAGSVDTSSTPAIEAVRSLAPGVWAVGSGSATLVVSFSDHLLVMDAPTAAADILARIAKLAPGKPIRFVVPTHHHDDHSGGIARFAAEGATIVTTPGNRKYFERMATARITVGGGIPPVPADKVRVETVAGKKRVFSDATRTVEIHDVGPSPHANEMLVAWLPAEGILFQADLIALVADGIVRPGTNNDTTKHFADWVKKQNWPVKAIVGAHGLVPNPGVLDELIKQPVQPRS